MRDEYIYLESGLTIDKVSAIDEAHKVRLVHSLIQRGMSFRNTSMTEIAHDEITIRSVIALMLCHLPLPHPEFSIGLHQRSCMHACREVGCCSGIQRDSAIY